MNYAENKPIHYPASLLFGDRTRAFSRECCVSPGGLAHFGDPVAGHLFLRPRLGLQSSAGTWATLPRVQISWGPSLPQCWASYRCPGQCHSGAAVPARSGPLRLILFLIVCSIQIGRVACRPAQKPQGLPSLRCHQAALFSQAARKEPLAGTQSMEAGRVVRHGGADCCGLGFPPRTTSQRGHVVACGGLCFSPDTFPFPLSVPRSFLCNSGVS